MAWLTWLTAHWLDVLQSVGIIGGLFFTGWTIHQDSKTQKATNLLKLTEQHRDLWMTLLTNPKFARILDNEIDVRRHPPTDDERRFVSMIILHLNSSYHAIKADVLTKPEGLTADIRSFFALPISQTVWEQTRHFFDSDFVAFVDDQRRARE